MQCLGPKNTPQILAGLKCDLRDEMLQSNAKTIKEAVTTREGYDCYKKNNFNGYVECSAKEVVNCDAVFNAAIKAIKVKKLYAD